MSTKIKQDELRRLMKERRENASQNERIKSPLAKYSSTGELSCTVCNITIQSNSLWVIHIASKTHKENIHKSIKKETPQPQPNFKRPIDQPIHTKRIKREKTSKDVQQKSTSVMQPIKSSNSSSDEEMEVDDSSTAKSVVEAKTNVLPPDFFDNKPAFPQSNGEVSLPNTVEPKVAKQQVSSSAEALPEGFFDDPFLDAKARNIEYKDPVEEEWEKFQKSIAEETNVSKTIIQEDLEESVLERNIVQIDEQIYQWERAKNLQCLADDVKLKAAKKDGDSEDLDDSDEDLEEDDLLDWRVKSIKKL